MRLMRHYQMAIVNAQRLAQQCTVSVNALGGIATIRVNVKAGVGIACAHAPLTSGAKGRYALAQGVLL